MRQQINLYQPILREEPKLFGAKAALRAFAAVLAVLVLLWGYGTYKVTRLEQTTQTLRDAASHQEQVLATASTFSAARATSTELSARVKRAEEEVIGRKRALELLRAGAAGRTNGFAARLEALARRHVEGVWIDRVALSGSTEAMSLGGATFDPDLVPRYLQNLSQESVLAGARFDQLAIERPHEKGSGQVRFRASSVSLPQTAASSSQSDEEGGAT
jgi:type IV pilus assembly PilN-like protein